MLLQNFIKTMCSGLMDTQAFKTTSGGRYSGRTVASSSTAFNGYNNTGSGGNSISYLGIALGTDDTPPVYTDTQIKTPITSGLVDVSHQNSNSGTTKTLTQTVRNDSADTITVKEIGIFATDSSNPNGSGYRILYTRNIINVPILPGETKTFTISINYDKFSESYSAT